MADAPAQYIHSTLYAFSGKAVEAVIGTLHRVVDNVAVRCHYDREEDVSAAHSFTVVNCEADWRRVLSSRVRKTSDLSQMMLCTRPLLAMSTPSLRQRSEKK